MGKIGSNSIPYLLQLYEQEEPHYGNLSRLSQLEAENGKNSPLR
jgi:hypothetical protein